MLQHMDSAVVSRIIYVTVGKFNHLQHSQILLVTDNKAGIVRLTIQHDMIVSVSFIYYPGDFVRLTSADILFLEECPVYI
jgi:hypothetical protein